MAVEGGAEEAGTRWTLDCGQVMVVDAEAVLEIEPAGLSPAVAAAATYRAGARGLLAQVRRTGAGYEVTAMAARTGREDSPNELSLGEFRLTARLSGAQSLEEAVAVPLAGECALGELLKAEFDSPGLRQRAIGGKAAGSVGIAQALRMMPPTVPLPPLLAGLAYGKGGQGRVEFSAAASWRDGELSVPELIVRLTGATARVG